RDHRQDGVDQDQGRQEAVADAAAADEGQDGADGQERRPAGRDADRVGLREEDQDRLDEARLQLLHPLQLRAGRAAGGQAAVPGRGHRAGPVLRGAQEIVEAPVNEETFLAALRDDPADELTWQALADWLEEDGQGERAELLRLTRQMRRSSPYRRGA